MTYSLLGEPVTSVPGVGPARARLLENLGIYTIEQLLYLTPRRHLDARRVLPVAQLVEGRRATVEGVVIDVERRPTRTTGLWLARLVVQDDAGQRMEIVRFSRGVGGRRPARIPLPAQKGARVTVSGIPKRGPDGGWTMQDAELERSEASGLHTGRMVPEYPLTAGLSQRIMRRIVQAALDSFAHRVPECLPADVRRAHALLARGDALRQLHFPDNPDKLAAARRRLAFEELFMLRLAVGWRGRSRRRHRRGTALPPPGSMVRAWQGRLSFAPTAAQLRVIAEIEHDLVQSVPMQRLLQGDVGSGKTMVAAYALLRAVEAGGQAALLAPSEILAEQHARTLTHWLAPIGGTVHLLTGAMSPQRRACVLDDVRAGRPVIVVGTHALLSPDVQFQRLTMVVVDEQHRFGVRQRSALAAGEHPPHLLVVSATPIPRTLALCLYGDLDVSIIDELPPGRNPVDTRWIRPERRGEVYKFVRRRVAAGRQAFVVFPAIGDDGGDGAGSPADTQVLAAAKRLTAGPLRDVRVGVLHGRQSAAEQVDVMQRFRDGDIQVLLATTIVEVGVDVPGAAVMVIEGADSFGLAQLHQLRGRVGRGGGQAHCFLIADPTTDAARRRLQSMRLSTDGFAIAQADLELRGPGELLGLKQSGLPDLSPLAQAADERVLADVDRSVRAMLTAPSASDKEVVGELRAIIQRRFGVAALSDARPGV